MEVGLRVLRLLVAAVWLATATGCSQVMLVPKADAMRAGELKNATVRTRTGEVFFFERAGVSADSLSGFAQETRAVYLAGGELQEVTEERQVYLALADVEQLSVAKRDWKRAGLWALGLAAAAGAIAVVAEQNSNSDTSGGNYGTPPKPTE
jgi:hypothetical protein